jgi:hypothetical protein
VRAAVEPPPALFYSVLSRRVPVRARPTWRGRTPLHGVSAAVFARRPRFTNSAASVTLVEFAVSDRTSGLAPVRRASVLGGFIRESPRVTALPDYRLRCPARSSRRILRSASVPRRMRPEMPTRPRSVAGPKAPASGPKRDETRSAGLAPEDILVYVERVKDAGLGRPAQGARFRRNRPHAGRQKNCWRQSLAFENECLFLI